MTKTNQKALLAAALIAAGMLHAHAGERLNILFITADDMNFDSAGVYGCHVESLTPNLDRLAGTAPSRWIKPEDIRALPGFLEDLPDVRKELAQYYTSVRRLDDCVGAVLRALDESGMRDKTLVMFFGGDHGMALPFAKSNLYENSMRGALILRWPGVIQPGRDDARHMVSTIDFTPTLLEAAGAAPIPGIDGRSFLSALRGKELVGDWDTVFAF